MSAGAGLATRPRRRVFPGRADQAREARRFVARTLDGCPVADTAVLLTGELVANALTHTRTRDDGRFEVIACSCWFAACVAVIDDGADTTPEPRRSAPDDLAESGHGLVLIDELATRWGHLGYHEGTSRRTAVWFRLDWTPG
jgi:anti-sigma regulatory factor (Ser/Thr protein kinase)